jgi:PEP-CTERM motif
MQKILILTVGFAMALSASAQGIFNGNTAASQIGSAGKIFQVDGATGLDPSYEAQWYIGPAGVSKDNEASLVAVGPISVFKLGAQAGFITPGPITTSYADGSIVTLQLRAWQIAGGADWLAQLNNPAGFSGKSDLYQVGKLVTGTVTPPQVAGFTGFSVISNVPEPSTIALGVMGLSVLLFRRRK